MVLRIPDLGAAHRVGVNSIAPPFNISADNIGCGDSVHIFCVLTEISLLPPSVVTVSSAAKAVTDIEASIATARSVVTVFHNGFYPFRCILFCIDSYR